MPRTLAHRSHVSVASWLLLNDLARRGNSFLVLCCSARVSPTQCGTGASLSSKRKVNVSAPLLPYLVYPGSGITRCGADEWRDVRGADAWRQFIERGSAYSSRRVLSMLSLL
ncbi:hypothetical protein M3J09_000607 [Ascochyta lentis]